MSSLLQKHESIEPQICRIVASQLTLLLGIATPVAAKTCFAFVRAFISAAEA
jgi:hypothetical protein